MVNLKLESTISVMETSTTDINAYRFISAMKHEEPADFKSATTTDVVIDRPVDGEEQVVACQSWSALECKEPQIDHFSTSDNIDCEARVAFGRSRLYLQFDSIEIFFTRFHSIAFENVQVVSKHADTLGRRRKEAAEVIECKAAALSEAGNLEPNGLCSNESKQKPKVRKVKDRNIVAPDVGDNVTSEIKPRRKRKKELASPMAPQSKGTGGGMPDLNGNAALSGLSVEGSLLKIQAGTEGKTGEKKRRGRRKKGTDSSIAGFAGVDGNSGGTIYLEVCLNEIGPYSPATPVAVGSNDASAASPSMNESSANASFVVNPPPTLPISGGTLS